MDSQLLTLLVRIDNLKQQGRLSPVVEQLFQDLTKYIQNQTALQDKQIELLNSSHAKVVQELRDFCNNLKVDNDSYIKEQVSSQVEQIITNNNTLIKEVKQIIQQEANYIKSTSPVNYASDHLRLNGFFKGLLQKLSSV